MAAKKKGLGRGLDALLGSANIPQKEVSTDASKPVTVSKEDVDGELRHLPIEFLQRGRYQPRRDMDPQALEDLSNSIKAQGVMQPIVVRPLAGANQYEIIAGERRWRASQLAGLDKVPCVIRAVTDEAAIAMALIENIQREDLNPIEEAAALQRFQDEFELTHQQVAEAVGKSRTTVTNLLRLMSLSPEARKLVEHGDLEMGHARAILTLDSAKQTEAGRTIVAKGLSVRQTEALVRRLQQEKIATGDTKIDPDIKLLQDNLSDKLGAPVMIQHSAKGKGKLVIRYGSLDELDGILDHIK
ncbi:MAG: chromosome partitioning protein ParB [Pseudomonadales bacterium]|jgi:ParB family chromosome partitioning protein|uniref:ParB/RepB/Spo0J family partition protein n=1 Tax=unclassified Ketobacter TaxID=2639109 RepID=UPI000C414DF5|nr:MULTISPECIES: ParB/RepB/Spo0J family partition protein [unclassified Ketobacter]MAA59360.1 chromosome partitioning protein ParB [Pseudomonadales bacterium]MEC8813177.1 ParB/RepB/Spo0J family partition protein [Pseudomonadota bacterium]TNC85961.1 MAG: chromosome partitioning protein ParB [Alcanivorax sp.]HAU16168.1 chromosome partitioning protein ParB [Gammaproteobacteria bacterium]MAQ24497.1 chromosome partitioning protein ParB [Pseudomonadales bacterium]|tara:strand:+ start:4129 stop:5028 length:900 start_codon:yes stop_codon:yes gene_type:complete